MDGYINFVCTILRNIPTIYEYEYMIDLPMPLPIITYIYFIKKFICS